MTRCSCWYQIVTSLGIVEHCSGTKECDVCSCGGDPNKCDFYPEKRMENDKMDTLTMMHLANVTGKTYISGKPDSKDMRYNSTFGFHDIHGNGWPGKAFETLNEVFSSEMQWKVIPENYMTRLEAEKKFNIKIID